MLNNLRLRTRLTLFMAIILFCVCMVLTTTLILSAEKIYHQTAMPSQHGTVISPTDNIETSDSNSTFRLVSFVSILLVFIVGTGATYIIAGKALSPITKLSRNIEMIDENYLFMPVSETISGDEVSKLSLSFNSMISKLEKAFITQKNFSANTAHELRTPLAAIISRIEVCQLDDVPSQQEYQDTLSDVLQSAERLNTLVNDLLEMTNGSLNDVVERIDLKNMFEHIISDVAGKNIENIKYINLVDDIHISGNKRLLIRAFLNLIQNATKYNKPDGTVEISTELNENSVIIKIKDSGIGIPSNQLDRIFEPFYCVNESRSRQFGGSGLGLALAKTIIEKHGGEICAKSELGSYTTIIVRLPY